MTKTTITGEIIKEYILKFPNTPKLTLAKKIYSENKGVFSSVEHCRTNIRMYFGSLGQRHREDTGVDFRKELAKLKKDLPKGESERVEPYVLPKTSRKILIIGDLHIPYHNDEAVFAALEFGGDKEVDTIIINGDLIDFYQLSRFEKDPRNRSVKYEIDATKVFLNGLRTIFPKALIIWALGNHCHRWGKYIIQQAPALLDIEAISMTELFELNKLSIKLVESNQYIYAGKLMISHGHNIGLKSGGVNVARTVRLKLNRSACVNHFHRETKDTGRVLDENQFSCWSLGALCDLNPNYLPVNDWSLGFGYVELEKNGNFRLYQKTIINGIVY